MTEHSDKLNKWAAAAAAAPQKTAQNEERGFLAYIAEEYSAYMLDYQLENPDSILWNVAVLYRMPKETDAVRLAQAFNAVCDNHLMLRSVFEKRKVGDADGVWTIKYAPEKSGQVEIIDITKNALDALIPAMLRPFTPGECVYRCRIYCTEEAKYLFIELHHSTIDGKSFRLLHQEIGRAYFGEQLEPDRYLELHGVTEIAVSPESFTVSSESLTALHEPMSASPDSVPAPINLAEYATIPRPDRNENGNYGSMEISWPEALDFTPESTLRHILTRLAENNNAQKSLCTWTWHSRDTVEKQHCIGLYIQDIPIAWDRSSRKMILFPRGTKWNLVQEQPVTYTVFQGRIHEFTGIPGIECEEIGQEIWHRANAPITADNALDIEFLDDSKGKRLAIKYDTGMYDEATIYNFLKP